MSRKKFKIASRSLLQQKNLSCNKDQKDYLKEQLKNVATDFLKKAERVCCDTTKTEDS